jgi:hypothetical protein
MCLKRNTDPHYEKPLKECLGNKLTIKEDKMKYLLILCLAVMILTIGCAKDNPVAVPETYNVTPAVQILTPALSWWDMSDSLFYVQINKTFYGNVVADTASLWLTAYIDTTAYATEYFNYRSGTWAWVLEDSFCVYRPADSVKLELTYWIGSGQKSTIDLWTSVRVGEK